MRGSDQAFEKKRPNYIILVVTLTLVVFGLIMIYDVSFYASQLSEDADAAAMLNSQVRGALLGTVAMLVLTFVDYHVWKKFALIGMGTSIVLLLLVLTPLGKNLNGAQRWFYIGGVSLQPAEIAKACTVLYMAAAIDRFGDKLRTWRGLLVVVAPISLACGLIFLQPNMSTMIAISLLMMILLFIGNAKLSHLGIMTGVAALVFGGITFFDYLKGNYRFRRYMAFLDPFASPRDEGYQLVQSLYAIGSGGILGTGFGDSRQKYLYLPYSESDFIFAIIAEEFGLIGCLILVAVFALLVWQGIKVAMKAPDMFGCLLAAGVTAMIGVQALIHIAVVTASMPPTGLPLPFISYGGTSLSIFMACMGILLSVSRFEKAA